MNTRTMRNISKKLMAGFLAIAMIATGVVIVPKTVKAASATEEYYANSNEYSIADYWNENKAQCTAPFRDGYVFAGWYSAKDEPLTASDIKDAGVTNVTAIAKFVPAEVLSIKVQMTTDEEGAILRILSSIDSKNYESVGFEYKLGRLGETTTEPLTVVYSAIKPTKDATEPILPGDTFVENVSKYFMAIDVNKINDNSHEKIVYARPYWVTLDGTTVKGLARNNRVVDCENNNQYTSVAINLLTDGNDKKMAQVAAGKIQVTYNSDSYKVVGVDTTYDATTGGKFLFPEMKCHDNEAGTITFVGNATEVDTNLTADGLFANIRFEKVDEDVTEALTVTVNEKATNFCNWVEATVDTSTFSVK